MSKSYYVPGVCNIGAKEIAFRKYLGISSLFLTLIIWGLIVLFNLNDWVYFLLFFPSAGAALSLIQAYSHFCVNFGMRGLFNFSNELKKTETISEREFREKDKSKSIKIILISLFIGLAAALTAYFLGGF